MIRLVGILGVAWAVLGVCGLLVFAIYRLSPKAIAAYQAGLSPSDWLIAAVLCVAFAYAEGYRGFQIRFSPRTAARIRYLRDRPDLVRSLLAPLFAMGFFHATRGTRITAYSLSSGIVVLVVLVNRLDQPWRGIIDAAVVVGLSWGVFSFLGSVAKALTTSRYAISPQVPPRQGIGSSTRE